ncbi:MAG: alpha/beta fold hydrolase [Acidobacteriota bacterium]
MNRKKFFILVAVFFTLGLATFTAASYFFAMQFISPANCAIGDAPQEFAFPIKNVSFTTEDGLAIRGWYAPDEKTRTAIILLHGHRGNRWQMYDTAKMLRRAGYGVLLYDARATGESEGKAISIGYFETKDLIAAVRFLREQGVERIACLGQSQGGATILMAAAKLDGVKCVIAQSSYDTICRAIDRRYREYLHIPGWLGGSLMKFFAEQKLGISAEQISPLREIKNLPCPVLIIAGENDTKTWAKDTRELFEAANAPKDLWMMEGAGHEDLYALRPQEYEKRVLEFLKKYL